MFWFVVSVSLILALTLAALKYLVMPHIEGYQAEILARVSEMSGMQVTAKSIRGGWSGFTPFVELEEVALRDTANARTPTAADAAVQAPPPALLLPNVRAAISIPSLLIGQIRFEELSLFGPTLALNRKNDGLIYFAGRPLNQPKSEPSDGRLIEWLLSQPGIEVHRARLTWDDDTTPGSTLVFTDVGINIDKRLRGHVVGFTATPPPTLATKLEGAGRLKIRNDNKRWVMEGTVFANIANANLTEMRRHAKLPDAWQSGVGTIRAWVDLNNDEAPNVQEGQFANPVKAVTADVHITNTKIQLAADTAPLNIAKLAGRLEFRTLEDGFSVGSKKLEFRTREGVISPPADFSIALRNVDTPAKASGEVTANGIDLKVMTALVEHFPIGKDVRAFVTKFSARGAVKDSRFAWTGPIEKPLTYEVRGTLSDFGMNASEKIPGVVGFSGTVEGNERGGSFTVDSKNFALAMPLTFADVLNFDAFESRGKWKVTPTDFAIDFSKLAFANQDMAIELRGKYARLRVGNDKPLTPAQAMGSLDISGKILRADATRVASYLPKYMKSREYIAGAVRSGTIELADFMLKGNVYDFPFRKGVGGKFLTTARMKNVDFRYAEGWPQIDNLNGELILDNAGMRVNVDDARVFGSRIGKTNLGVSDFGDRPAILSIAGQADARAEDVMRYFRESPMVDGVGAFTKFMNIEGPGRLELDLKIPLGTATAEERATPAWRTKIGGKYTLNGGTAKAKNIGPLISNLAGSISFSETAIKSNNLAGQAFGQLMSIVIAGGGEAGVTTELVGRADVQQLGDLIPFKMPAQVTGVADVKVRIAARSGGVDITAESPMLGVVSALPYPLAKERDEPRALTVALTAIGQPAEKIRLTLQGNAPVALTGNAAIPGSTALLPAGATNSRPDTRIEARFQRKPDGEGNRKFYGGLASVGVRVNEGEIPEGLWLTGSMRELQFDQWLAAFKGFDPKPVTNATDLTAVVAAPTVADSPIAGFDFSLGQLVAYGRPFANMKIKGRRAQDVWAMSVESPEAEGDFTWRGSAFRERGAIRARLKKFVLTDEVPGLANGETASSASVNGTNATNNVKAASANSAAVVEPVAGYGDLPALDIVAETFTFKGTWLGKLELRATPQVANWQIDSLVLSNGHARAEMDGLWQRYGDPFAEPNQGAVKSLTTMNIKLESSNLNALFGQFGFGEAMKGGRGGLSGKLSWPGHVYQFQTNNLSGSFKVDAERGQFAKIEVGVGKLLGLISLQSVTRRLNFDFRDVANEGLAFDKIDGDVNIANGVMFVKKFEILGPALDVRMTGDVSLPTERTNLALTVAPKLTGLAAIGAGFLVSPVVGLGVLVGGEALKSPIERVLSVQYAITGTWDNPTLERTGRTTAPVTPPAAATPAPAPAAEPTKPVVPTTSKAG